MNLRLRTALTAPIGQLTGLYSKSITSAVAPIVSGCVTCLDPVPSHSISLSSVNLLGNGRSSSNKSINTPRTLFGKNTPYRHSTPLGRF
jgi:hypothetical protein